ncbi:C69 family dipeptidase [bacterium]|nr:C69 family dipeptidase [bacterium]
MVGKKASTDGSAITAHSCDGPYRTWLKFEQANDYAEGAMRKINWGTMHTETAWEERGILEKGEIPQVAHTYAYMNVCYPCMNEKQLAIGETTFGGRKELKNDEGLFVIEELQRIVLERCTTAREAIKLIGRLVAEHGYGDSGECLTFVDKKEIWHFEIMGAGFTEVSAVWAAVRIPDDHVAVSANICRISKLELDKVDWYMASENVYRIAEENEWWNPDSSEFIFWKAYSGRKPYSIREFYVLSTLAPSANLDMEMEELPFSIKPDNKVSVRDVMKFYRETYEGTEWDMTRNFIVEKHRPRGAPEPEEGTPPEMVKSPIANPWMTRYMRNLVNTLKPETAERQRTIAIAGCSYSQIIQVRDWLPDEIGGLAWFSFDNPGQSPRIPIYAGTLSLPKSFEICGQHQYREDAAIWKFRKANRLSSLRWGRFREDIEGAVQEFEDKAFDELSMVEEKALDLYKQWKKEEKKRDKAREKALEAGEEYEDEEIVPEYKKYLTRYTDHFARAAMSKWEEMGQMFWAAYNFGF